MEFKLFPPEITVAPGRDRAQLVFLNSLLAVERNDARRLAGDGKTWSGSSAGAGAQPSGLLTACLRSENPGVVNELRRMTGLLALIACLGVPRPPGGGAQPAVSGASAGGKAERQDVELREGGIIRGSTSARRLALVFTGHGYAEGGEVILNELGKRKGKGSFFFTGDFLTNTTFQPLIERLVKEGHYLGPHSDKHLLYCPWDGPKQTLVTHAEFRADLESNLRKIERFGVPRRQIRYFLPPYEHYNEEIVDWTKELGLTLVNFTPGTRSNADYTGEAEKNFVSSRTIFDSIVAKEKRDPHGLNGFLLLVHIGSGPGRTDKFPARFGELLNYLAGKGYQFVRVDELLAPK